MASRGRDFGEILGARRAAAWAGGKMTDGWALVDSIGLWQFRSEQKWIHGRSGQLGKRVKPRKLMGYTGSGKLGLGNGWPQSRRVVPL